MPKPLRLALILACIAGFIWPFFNALSIFDPPSILQIVIFGEIGAILYGFSDLPPFGRAAKAMAVTVFVALPVTIAILLR